MSRIRPIFLIIFIIALTIPTISMADRSMSEDEFVDEIWQTMQMVGGLPDQPAKLVPLVDHYDGSMLGTVMISGDEYDLRRVSVMWQVDANFAGSSYLVHGLVPGDSLGWIDGAGSLDAYPIAFIDNRTPLFGEDDWDIDYDGFVSERDVERVRDDLNREVNTLTGHFRLSTKAVPMLTFPDGGYLGEAQVYGWSGQVSETEVVWMAPERIDGKTVHVTVPSSSFDASRVERVERVGVSAMVETSYGLHPYLSRDMERDGRLYRPRKYDRYDNWNWRRGTWLTSRCNDSYVYPYYLYDGSVYRYHVKPGHYWRASDGWWFGYYYDPVVVVTYRYYDPWDYWWGYHWAPSWYWDPYYGDWYCHDRWDGHGGRHGRRDDDHSHNDPDGILKKFGPAHTLPDPFGAAPGDYGHADDGILKKVTPTLDSSSRVHPVKVRQSIGLFDGTSVKAGTPSQLVLNPDASIRPGQPAVKTIQPVQTTPVLPSRLQPVMVKKAVDPVMVRPDWANPVDVAVPNVKPVTPVTRYDNSRKLQPWDARSADPVVTRDATPVTPWWKKGGPDEPTDVSDKAIRPVITTSPDPQPVPTRRTEPVTVNTRGYWKPVDDSRKAVRPTRPDKSAPDTSRSVSPDLQPDDPEADEVKVAPTVPVNRRPVPKKDDKKDDKKKVDKKTRPAPKPKPKEERPNKSEDKRKKSEPDKSESKSSDSSKSKSQPKKRTPKKSQDRSDDYD